jgi:hypothetical protein
VVGLAVGYAIVILLLPLPASGDVYSYAFYGRIMSVYDANPYVATPSMFSFDPMYPGVPTFWVSTPSVYGLGFSLMSAAHWPRGSGKRIRLSSRTELSQWARP